MSPTIRIDDEVYAALQDQAVAFVDTPNSVLRRVLGLAARDELAEPGHTGSEPALTAQGPRAPAGTRSTGGTHKRKTRRTKRRRAATGTILREEEYEVPLLEILEEGGGAVPAGDAIEKLGVRLKDKLMPKDLESLASGRIRWHNRAQFVRLRLVEAGDMKNDSPRGVWEISDRGRNRLRGGDGS